MNQFMIDGLDGILEYNLNNDKTQIVAITYRPIIDEADVDSARDKIHSFQPIKVEEDFEKQLERILRVLHQVDTETLSYQLLFFGRELEITIGPSFCESRFIIIDYYVSITDESRFDSNLYLREFPTSEEAKEHLTVLVSCLQEHLFNILNKVKVL